jgi:hypothetical protein
MSVRCRRRATATPKDLRRQVRSSTCEGHRHLTRMDEVVAKIVPDAHQPKQLYSNNLWSLAPGFECHLAPPAEDQLRLP